VFYRQRVRIDLNADLGEGFGAWKLTDDDALLEIVTSANVACGFHAGDPLIMWRVCGWARTRGVTIGAQVGYHDLVGFGRRRIDVDPPRLWADVLYQIGALDAFARAAGMSVRYVKPHGALYNTAADDQAQAHAVATAIASFSPDVPLLGLAGSEHETAAREAGIPFVAEAFADRAYTARGRLVPRSEPGAVHSDLQTVLAQAVSIVRDGQVTAVDGTPVPVRAESLCLHGDTAGAVDLARAVRARLTEIGVDVKPFAS